MTNALLLRQFVDGELSRSADLLVRTLLGAQEQLRQQHQGRLPTLDDRQHVFELAQALPAHQAVFQQRFTENLRETVLAELNPVFHGSGVNAPGSMLGRLQLLDEARVEVEIEISRAIQLISSCAEGELHELQTLTSMLRDQERVTAESNPLRPQAYVQALWQAIDVLPVAPAEQRLLLHITAGVMAGFLKAAWAEAGSRLKSQGITPDIYRTVVPGQGVGRPPAPEVDITQPGALDTLRRAMPHGEGWPRPAEPAPDTAELHVSMELEHALVRVEALLNRQPTAHGYALRAPALKLADHRQPLLAATGDIVERQTIELLSQLFDVILSDPSLHPPLRRILARLQVPALRIALHDPGMLEDHRHPAWLLIARLVSIGTSYPFPADPRLLALLSFSDTLVSYTAALPHHDAAVMRSGLMQLDAFMNEQLRQQQQQAQVTIDALARAEQTDSLQQSLSEQLAARAAAVPVGPVIHRFLTGPWARLLTHATLSFGDKDEQTLGYHKVVDHLLWSLNMPDHPQSRQHLLALLPGLLQRLRVGMSLADMPLPEQQQVLEELMARHAEALRRGGRTPHESGEAAQAPDEIMRRLREEFGLPPEPPDFKDSLIEPASMMNAVPAGLMPPDTAPRRPPVPPGQRYRMFLHGRWMQVQLLWRSAEGHYLLFAGESAEHTHAITQRAMERLREAGLVQIVDAHVVIQQVVDTLLEKLRHPR